jgi:hypothetical protein
VSAAALPWQVANDCEGRQTSNYEEPRCASFGISPFDLLLVFVFRSPVWVGMFVIEDEIHCDWHGQYASFDAAVAELRRRALLPWDQPPNAAPCTSWKTCGREYFIIEIDDSCLPWKELRRVPVLEVSEAVVKWSTGFHLPG